MRYYGSDGAWTKLSYQFALTQPANYFRNQIVFIGTQPHTTLPENNEDGQISHALHALDW